MADGNVNALSHCFGSPKLPKNSVNSCLFWDENFQLSKRDQKITKHNVKELLLSYSPYCVSHPLLEDNCLNLSEEKNAKQEVIVMQNFFFFLRMYSSVFFM